MVRNKKIFIQLAAYRDPELIPTIKDCINNAKYPENLVFSICWQHAEEDKWDNLDEFKNDPRFKIIDLDYEKAKGACWARYQLQKQYDDEGYTLQLDSHMRFSENWDQKLFDVFNKLVESGVKKPLITSYASSYEPSNDPKGRVNVPWKMNFDRFTPEGYIFFMPSSIDEYKELDGPIRGRFYSAHYAFTYGDFVREVPHDPDFYFHGEEISIAVRAYTWGYDIYHPNEVIIWHEYTRNEKKKQWDDDIKWVNKNNSSHKKNRMLFGMDGEKYDPYEFGISGFGPIRSLDDYERYAGVSFSKRGVQQYTLDQKEPPNPETEKMNDNEFNNSLLFIFKHCIDIHQNVFKQNDYDFWVVSFERNDGTVIHREDADEKEVNNLIKNAKNNNGWIKLWRQYTGDKPDKWVVWPHSKSKGWCERQETKI